MHVPKHFQQKDELVFFELISSHPFATLVSIIDGVVAANHLPLVIAGESSNQLVLQGHVARANPLWEKSQEQFVLAIFYGPHAYISPSAYPSKKEHGKVVPTWNYSVVHAAGRIKFIHELDWKLEFLNRLTNLNEKAELEPWSVSDAPREFIEKLSGAIVGLEIAVETLDGQWKLSQNQPQQHQAGVVTALEARTDTSSQAVAQLIRQCCDNFR